MNNKSLYFIVSAGLFLSASLNAAPNYYNITDNSTPKTIQSNYSDQTPNNSDAEVSNEQLLGEIQYILKGSFKNYNVNVNTNDGVVTLTGVVNSDNDKTSITSKIQNIRGVKKVNNQLQVGNLKALPQRQ